MIPFDKKILAGALLLSITLLSACQKHKYTDTSCINGKIKQYSRYKLCEDAVVNKYTFQGKTVYVFEPGTCGADMSAPVLDEDCNMLGNLGGFSGNNIINDEPFDTNAVLIETVWPVKE